MTKDEFLTAADVSRIINVPRATLRTWRARGYGPRGFAMGGTVRYRRSVVEAWIAEQERAEDDRRVPA